MDSPMLVEPIYNLWWGIIQFRGIKFMVKVTSVGGFTLLGINETYKLNIGRVKR